MIAENTLQAHHAPGEFSYPMGIGFSSHSAGWDLVIKRCSSTYQDCRPPWHQARFRPWGRDCAVGAPEIRSWCCATTC